MVQKIVKNAVLKMKNHNCRLAISESCTGGLVSKLVTDVPGSSKIFMGSIVAYNSLIKNKLLNIDCGLIADKGSVSGNIASAMAVNVRKIFDSEIGAAVTGVSGPSSDKEGNSVGLAYVAVSTSNDTVVQKIYKPKLSRAKHREYVAIELFRLIENSI